MVETGRVTGEPSCVFCGIGAGNEDASIVYGDESVVAFLDTLPINAGHTLIIPRRHATNLSELDPSDGAKLFQTGQRVAAALRASEIECDGINLVLNDGVAAGQRVFHVHLHVIPRISGDSLRRDLSAQGPARKALDSVAKNVRDAFH